MKALKNIGAIISIVVLSVLVGFFAQYLKNAYDRSLHPRDFEQFVSKYAEEYRVPEAVVYSVIKCESSFNSAAVSSSGAIGLMQIMPKTFTYLCEKIGETHETGMLYDPETNIKYGTFYLSMLYERFGVWANAFAAYNAGPSRVEGWIEEGRTDEGGVLNDIPIAQTKVYVERVTTAIKRYEELYYIRSK